MVANRENIAGAKNVLRVESRGDRWRAWSRFLIATLTLATLYMAIEHVWLWGSQQVAYTGWTPWDPTQQYAEQAVAIAEQSKAREAKLNPHQDRTVFELGIQYGYVSNSLYFGDAPEEQISALARRALDRNPRGDMQTNAQRLGLDTVRPLRAVDEIDLTKRLENDVGGVAARIEQLTSPRLRHLFMLGVHAGAELSRLEPPRGILWSAPMEIGMHGTLAGVPEPLWRQLTRVSRHGEPFEPYRAAVYALDLSLTKKAADTGDADAMTSLGNLYASSQGEAQNFTEAREWYAKAADKGDPTAKMALERLPIREAAASGRYAEALQLQEALATKIEAVETNRDGKPGNETAERLNEVAWYALFARDFTKALTAADRAHALIPDNLEIETNRAHALMFLGREDEAKALYLAHKGEPVVGQGKLWERVVVEDLAELRKAGLTYPMMADIEKSWAPPAEIKFNLLRPF